MLGTEAALQPLEREGPDYQLLGRPTDSLRRRRQLIRSAALFLTLFVLASLVRLLVSPASGYSPPTANTVLFETVSLDQRSDDSRDHDPRDHDGREIIVDSEDSGDCAGEFKQCAGSKGGEKFTQCCKAHMWCMQFGDGWWGMCMPSRIFGNPNMDNRNQHQWNHHG